MAILSRRIWKVLCSGNCSFSLVCQIIMTWSLKRGSMAAIDNKWPGYPVTGAYNNLMHMIISLLSSNDTMGQQSVVCSPQLTVAGETETSAIQVSIQMEILAGSSLPPPPSVQKPTGNCLDEFRCPAEASNTPWCCQSLKDCVSKGVRGGNEQINRTHSEFRRLQLFHLYLPEKIVIYLPHMSAWTLNVHSGTRTRKHI